MQYYQRQGIAGQLLQKTIKLLEERPNDCNHVFCDIQEENETSLNLFKRHNFQIGRKFRYIDLMLPRKKINSRL
ncbi:GNAT family N-acetyltransferase [Candidatus Collierbacteria bacterium]|nr:GNAT family N-acetyltransferase [Candidatus Collierbacteria bacterium]